jgi:hypothetical protein
MLANKHIRALQPDREFLRREFQRGPRTYAHLFAVLHRQHAQILGKTRWGDQTESLERFADPIFAAFPKARIIHMLRDPRDRYEAIVARGSSYPGRLGEATAQWMDSAHLALRNERLYSDRYKVMRYETMVTKPEEALREVCAFLGITSIPEMLALGNASRFKNGYKNGASKRSPLSTEYIGRFQHHLASYELAYIQQRTELLIAVLGYPPVPVRLSPIDKARCAAITAITYFSRFAGRIGRENPLELGALS